MQAHSPNAVVQSGNNLIFLNIYFLLGPYTASKPTPASRDRASATSGNGAGGQGALATVVLPLTGQVEPPENSFPASERNEARERGTTLGTWQWPLSNFGFRFQGLLGFSRRHAHVSDVIHEAILTHATRSRRSSTVG